MCPTTNHLLLQLASLYKVNVPFTPALKGANCDYGLLIVPSAPVLTATVTATTITITGSVPSVSIVTGLVVEWQRDTSVGCSDVNQISLIGAFSSYIITGLEPDSNYLITVRVYNFLGSAPTSTVSATTEEIGAREREREKERSLIITPPQLPLATRGQ